MEGSITTVMEAVIGLVIAFTWFVFLKKKKKGKLKDLPKENKPEETTTD